MKNNGHRPRRSNNENVQERRIKKKNTLNLNQTKFKKKKRNIDACSPMCIGARNACLRIK